ncbi:MAG TPA: serine hydrolase domain-containing protein [Vicinamibacterales bacterium]|nr:serine hydrolase domain-containing protein [Vicinamibacterales bacterium]
MSTVFNRRSFLSASGRAALGWPLLSLAACTRRDSVPAAADDGEWRTLIEYVEKEIPSLLDRSATTPGAAIALVADAQLLWSRGFGVTDRTTNAPVNADTVFEFGSVSKTVFAYEVMKACEKGLLDLDTPLTKYTSERFLAGDPRLDLMTARHVLSHTGGFQNWRSPEDPLKIQFTPGARWDYSGEGYSYLQSVLTHVAGRVDPNDCKTFYDGLRVCGTDFDAYMKANLFVPFGMASSGYLYRDGMARPHNEKGVMIADRIARPPDAARYGSAGELHSTVSDYAKFLIEIIDPKPADAFRLSTASRAEMIRPQVKIKDTLAWGLGWAIERQPGMSDILTHSGDNPGFKAMTAASVDRRSAFIAVTNGDRGFDDVIRPLVRSSQMREFLPVSL